MPTRQPSASRFSGVSLVGVLFVGAFLAAILVAGLSTGGWVKRLDQPPAGTYRIASGNEWSVFLKLAQKSIKGLHRTNGVRGHLEVPGEPAPRPLAVRDTTSTDWGAKIKIPQSFAGVPAAHIETSVALLLATQVPADPALIGRTFPVTFDLDLVLPCLDPRNPKSGMDTPVQISGTVQLEIMPPGYTRLYRRIGHIALIVAGVALALILIRLSLLKRRPAASRPAQT